MNKYSYFQGGVGVNEPAPNKYKSDPAIIVQPRFKEPFYRNFDLYSIKDFEHIGPGTGWSTLQDYKSVSDFLQARKKLNYQADDSYKLNDGSISKQARKDILNSLIKYKNIKDFIAKNPLVIYADDNNKIDFPIDNDINHDTIIYPEEGEYHNPKFIGPDGINDLSTFPTETGALSPESLQSAFTAPQIAGEHSYLPLPDFEDRSEDALNFGRDYTEDAEYPGILNEEDLQQLENKYLMPAEPALYGLQDGISPISDLDPEQTIQTEDPFTGTSDIGTGIYQDKWNI